MTAATLALLVHAALAGPTQTVTLVLQGVQAGDVVTAIDGDGRTTRLTDPGIGVLVGHIEGPPRRQMQVRMVAATHNGPPREIYEGLLLLTDAEHETVAFAYDPRRELHARRVPSTPSARTELALDQRATWWVAFGWAGIVTLWSLGLGVAWAIRRR